QIAEAPERTGPGESADDPLSQATIVQAAGERFHVAPVIPGFSAVAPQPTSGFRIDVDGEILAHVRGGGEQFVDDVTGQQINVSACGVVSVAAEDITQHREVDVDVSSVSRLLPERCEKSGGERIGTGSRA